MYAQLTKATSKPVAWSSYTAPKLWTDPHISAQMLQYHLNPQINAASRSFDFIDQSVDWLMTSLNLGPASSTIDFGCGPGLYTQRFKARGVGQVVGLDFSKSSLDYAKQQAAENQLNIDYRLGNYLEYQDESRYDLISLVMCDFCALSPAQRHTLLAKFKKLLKPNGKIALDLFTFERFEQLTESVELVQNHLYGFWAKGDYWCIHASHKYETEKLHLDQYLIVEAQGSWPVYNWLQHFSLATIQAELASHQLQVEGVFDDLKGSIYSQGEEMGLIISHA